MAMKWSKDRRKAFLWAAEAFGTPKAKRTERQRKLTCFGICNVIHRLTDSIADFNQIIKIGDKMGIESTYWWPIRGREGWRTIHDKQRSLFCYLMAALSDKEFKELGK